MALPHFSLFSFVSVFPLFGYGASLFILRRSIWWRGPSSCPQREWRVEGGTREANGVAMVGGRGRSGDDRAGKELKRRLGGNLFRSSLLEGIWIDPSRSVLLFPLMISLIFPFCHRRHSVVLVFFHFARAVLFSARCLMAVGRMSIR